MEGIRIAALTDRLRLLAGILPVLLCIAAILVLHLLYPAHSFTRAVFDPPLLLPALNTVFLCLTAYLVSFMAMRSYLLTGALTVLLFGCGVLALGTGSLAAGWLIGPFGANVAVTVFNLPLLLASVFHTAAAAANIAERSHESDQAKRRGWLTVGFLGVLVFVAAVSLAAVAGITPPFFMKGTGWTALRQTVLIVTLILFAISFASMMVRFAQKGVHFFYWYSLALALLASAVGALLLQPAVGSPVGWVGRIAQYVAGIYFIVAVIAAMRDPQVQGTNPGVILGDIFSRSERKIAAILENMTDCHYELDRNWCFTRINDRALAYFGRKREDLLGRDYWDALNIPRGAVFDEHFKRAVRERVPVHFDLPSVAVPGKWAEVHVYPVEVGISVYFRDITDRKRDEAIIQEERDRLSALVNSIEDEIWFASISKDLILANRSALREFGLDTVSDVNVEKLATDLEVYRPDGSRRPVEEAPPLRALKGETVRNLEEMIRSPGSGEFRYREVNASPVRDGTGAVIGSVSVVRDITERKEAEEARKRSMERLAIVCDTASRLLMSQNPQLIVEELCGKVMAHLDCHAFLNYLVDDQRNCLRLNAYAGIPEEAASEIHFLDFGVAVCGCAAREACRIVAENIPTTPDIRTNLVRSFGIKAYACHPLFAAGQVIGTLSFGTRSRLTFSEDELSLMKAVADQVATAMERIRLLRASQERAEELEIRVQDRTAELNRAYEALRQEMDQHRQTEEQLRQSQKMEAVGTLAGGIAHDFNNILAGIIGFTEMAIEDVPDRPLVEKNLSHVLKSAMRARDLVKQILAFSRKTNYERSPLSLSPVIRETVQLLRASIPATIAIQLSVTARSDTILASPTEVQQILMNLSTNASLAMEEKGGTLGISLADASLPSGSPESGTAGTPGEFLEIAVKDTGTGMSPEVMGRIFEPFFTTREVGKGSGMGLAVVYGIVKDLQGMVTVESEPGEGSTFRVFLPRAGSTSGEEGTRTVSVPKGTERVLFIDDEAMLAEWGRETLERLDYEVTALTDPEEGLEVFSSDPSRFDLVITDQTMPSIAGMELTRRLLAIRPDIPVILCTGHSTAVDLQTAKDAGVRQFLMKPLSRQELAEVVRLVLDGGRME